MRGLLTNAGEVEKVVRHRTMSSDKRRACSVSQEVWPESGSTATNYPARLVEVRFSNRHHELLCLQLLTAQIPVSPFQGNGCAVKAFAVSCPIDNTENPRRPGKHPKHVGFAAITLGLFFSHACV